MFCAAYIRSDVSFWPIDNQIVGLIDLILNYSLVNFNSTPVR